VTQAFARYRQAVDYLERRLWHDLPIISVERALQSRIRTLLSHLGDPQRLMAVVHVGGSAGKGSTATMTAAILQAAGLRTGRYTSPHLQTFIERIAVDGRLIAPDDFADTVLGLDPLVRTMHIDVLDGIGFGRPALVEVAFATGMAYFARERCDAAVVEVGLGGRTDCTNIFDDKPVTVITNVEYEHRERLGPTIADIAREKSAIIRGQEIVVTGARRADALRVIEERCAATGATPWRLGREIRLRVLDAGAEGSIVDVRTPAGVAAGVRVPLAGRHQARNAAIAIAASFAFAANTGMPVSADDVARGLDGTRPGGHISGRLERVHDAPRVLLDGAHNPAGARELAAALREHVLRRGVRLHLVCGILGDKEQPPMVRALADVAYSVIVTQPPLVERAGDPERTAGLFEAALGRRRVRYEPEPARALDAAIAAARSRDVVCVTGSMYLVGALRERWVPEETILRRRHAGLGA
jgi:dihydrofolate synthase/folylpolyglutamate synthase